MIRHRRAGGAGRDEGRPAVDLRHRGSRGGRPPRDGTGRNSVAGSLRRRDRACDRRPDARRRRRAGRRDSLRGEAGRRLIGRVLLTDPAGKVVGLGSGAIPGAHPSGSRGFALAPSGAELVAYGVLAGSRLCRIGVAAVAPPTGGGGRRADVLTAGEREPPPMRSAMPTTGRRGLSPHVTTTNPPKPRKG